MPAPGWLLAVSTAMLTSCSEPAQLAEFSETRIAGVSSSVVRPGVTTAQRLGREPLGGAPQRREPGFDFDLPQGWDDLGSSGQRLIDLRPAGEPEAQCYLSFLQGDGGGLAANVDRWYAQMGQPGIDAATLAALPRRPLFSGEAVVVDVEGAFQDMGATEAKPGYRMLGVIAPSDQFTIFVKFTAPRELVELEKERFFAFVDSIEPVLPGQDGGGDPHYAGDGHDHDGDGLPDTPTTGAAAPALPAGPHGGSGGFTWTAPDGWVDQGARPMRHVSYELPEGTECYVTLLGGDGGGLVMNLQRWSEQLGGDELTPAELDALPKIELLGQTVPMIEVSGTYTSMGGDSRPDHTLRGVACIRPAGGSVFVKMIGPTAEVEAARADFIAFCASFEESQ